MRVRLEPLGEQIDCRADETILEAAFRQGYNLIHGCREGQCSACKSLLWEGEVALAPHSSFALSDAERQAGYTLMCRAMPQSDLVVELLHVDPDGLRLNHPIADFQATVRACEPLTDDISRLRLSAPEGFAFTPGQYIDLHVPGRPGARRSFSIANLPGEDHIELIIKRYPGGRISGLLESGALGPGERLGFTGPYGSLRLREGDRSILMIAGGSGLAPILSLLRQLAAQRSRRTINLFFGARTEGDLFALEELAALGRALVGLRLRPVTGRPVHEAVQRWLEGGGPQAPDVYMCGPPAMIEAAEAMLAACGIDSERIFADRFTTAAEAQGALAVTPAGEQGAATGDPAGEQGAAAGGPAGERSEREFTWFAPARRRASLYEDVTIDTQPSIHRHLTRGWPLRFADGRGIWDEGATALRCQDWFAFRDPGELWERTFYQVSNAREQQLEAALGAAAAQGLLSDLTPGWIALLADFLQVGAFYEHGLWLALATAARDALSDSLATCICLQAAMKQRSAQAIVLHAMELERQLGVEMGIERARQAFLEQEAWQPTRAYLEGLAATADFGEVIVAANLCLEPLVGTLLRRELGIRAAAANGDTVTPVLARVAAEEWEWARAWTVALVAMLIDDERHAEANRRVLAGWVGAWLPRALAAAQALIPIAQRIPAGIDGPRSLSQVRGYAGALLADAGLGELAPLLGAAPATPTPAPAAPATPTPAPATPTPAPAVPSPGGAATFDYVGIVMAKSAEGDAVARLLARRPEVEVREQPAFWDIRAPGRLRIPYAEVSEELGYAIDAYSIQHEMSTHYGRMIATDEALMLFCDPTEALGHLIA